MPQNNPADPGYNAEEDHFRRKDMEWVARRRAELDAKRQAQTAGGRPANWMQCPRCGGQMQEQKMDVVMIDRCGKCGGVFFDAGEVDMLLQSQSSGALSSLRKLFGGK